MDVSAPSQSASTNNPGPQEPGYWRASNSNALLDDPNLGSCDYPEPPRQLHRGSDISSFNLGSDFPIPIARPQQSQQSHADRNRLNNVGTFDLAGYTGQANLRPSVHPSGSAQDHQAGCYAFPPVLCRENDNPALSSTGSRVSIATSSGNPWPNETPSGNGFQESSAPPAIPFSGRSDVVTSGNGPLLTNGEGLVVEGNTLNVNLSPSSIPVPFTEPLNLDQNEAVIGMPNWVALIKPLPRRGETVITHRRDNHFALEIILEHLPREPPDGCSGIKVPATASVKNCADTTDKTLLGCCIRLYGATTKQPYEVVCDSCQKREGKRRGTPSLIDFKAEYDMIEPKDGKIRVEFEFCCYPKCHGLGDTEYLLDIILSEDEYQNHIVAQCRLPFSFKIKSKLPPIQRSKKRPRSEDGVGDSPAPEPPTKRPRPDDANAPTQGGSPSGEQVHHPVPTVGHRSTPQGVQSHGDGSSSSFPLVPTPQPPPNAGPGSAPVTIIEPLNQATSPPKRDGERIPTLTEVNPDSGSTTGGVRIWLKGMDFPALFPLFARFGAAVVPTTFSSSNILACHLPPRNLPGVISVTLSKDPQPNAPEYGTSIARFQYKGDHDELISILLRIQGQAYSPLLRALLTALNNQGNSDIHRGAISDDPVQAGPTYQFGDDFDPTLGSFCVGPPEQQHGGFGISAPNPIWSFPTNMANPLSNQSQDSYFWATPTPVFMNQGFNASIPSRTTAQQHQWNPSSHFPPSTYSQNRFCVPPLFNPTGYPHSNNLMAPVQQNQSSNIAGSNQSTMSPFGTQVVAGMRDAPISGRSSYQNNPQDQYSTSVHFSGTVSPRTESQTNGNLYATTGPTHTIYETVNRLGTSPTNGRANQMENNVLMNTPLVNPGQPSPAQSSQLIPDSVGVIPYRRLPKPLPKPLRTLKRARSSSASSNTAEQESRPNPVRIPTDSSLSVHDTAQPCGWGGWSPVLVAQGGSTKDYYPAVEMAAQRDLEAEGRERFQAGEPMLLIPQSAAQEIVTGQPTDLMSTVVGRTNSSPHGYEPPIGHHLGERRMGSYPGPSIPATAAGPFDNNQSLPTDIPLQIPTPSNSHLISNGGMDMLIPNIEIDPSVQRSFLLHSLSPPARYDTDNPMGQSYFMNAPAIPRRMPEPLLDSQHNHLPLGGSLVDSAYTDRGDSNDEDAFSAGTLRPRISLNNISCYQRAGEELPMRKRSPAPPDSPPPSVPEFKWSSTAPWLSSLPRTESDHITTQRKSTSASEFDFLAGMLMGSETVQQPAFHLGSPRMFTLDAPSGEAGSICSGSPRRTLSNPKSPFWFPAALVDTSVVTNTPPDAHTNGSDGIGRQLSSTRNLHGTVSSSDHSSSGMCESEAGVDNSSSSLAIASGLGLTWCADPVVIQYDAIKESAMRFPALLPAFDSTQGGRPLQGNRGSEPREGLIESSLVKVLSSLQPQPNFQEVVSTTNDWGQSLAHLSILHDYPSLLGHLVDWHIDLTIADANGLTALHYAYMKGDLDSVRTLRGGGASESVVDKLGRTPLELRPEDFGSVIGADAKVAVS